jgi:hypothetical protein
MRVFRLFSGTFLRLALTVLSGDLLYLYYAGGWRDPVKYIEIIELIALYLLAACGIIWLITWLKGELLAYKRQS